MSPDEFLAALNELGLSQVELARELSEAAGEPVAATTIYRYAHGHRKVPAGLVAYLKLRIEIHCKKEHNREVRRARQG